MKFTIVEILRTSMTGYSILKIAREGESQSEIFQQTCSTSLAEYLVSLIQRDQKNEMDESFDAEGKMLPFGRCDSCGRPNSGDATDYQTLMRALKLIAHATAPGQDVECSYHENAYGVAIAALRAVGDPADANEGP